MKIKNEKNEILVAKIDALSRIWREALCYSHGESLPKVKLKELSMIKGFIINCPLVITKLKLESFKVGEL